jgi:alginate O-acetyltransferase complex protein AlgI
MLFASISFLYYFLPIFLGLYFIVPKKFRNAVLLLASLFFYFHGEPKFLPIMIISIVSGYVHGLWIDKSKERKQAKIALVSSVVVSIGILGIFKYLNFFIENINKLWDVGISPVYLIMPIGISFYTFQILSYTIDVYKGEAKVQKNILTFATYISLFPQLIAGPIVRYTTVEADLIKRSHSFEDAAYGINRFIIGLSKKVIIANTLGELAKIFSGANEKTVLFYWIIALAFMLQIYFDFSGYSDMAIGIGRILGFHFLENFNYPYISRSITEFWRRWHISLGTWFRDYVYIPMGGSYGGIAKWIRNIIVVWFLTGFWHGAKWNFIMWGLYFALFLLFEKLFLKNILKRLPRIISHIYTLFFVATSFVIFNADNLKIAVESLMGMFGMLPLKLSSFETMYYLKSYGFVLIIASIGATPFMSAIITRAKGYRAGRKMINILEPIMHISLLLLITGYLIDGSFNPFLYFRF